MKKLFLSLIFIVAGLNCKSDFKIKGFSYGQCNNGLSLDKNDLTLQIDQKSNDPSLTINNNKVKTKIKNAINSLDSFQSFYSMSVLDNQGNVYYSKNIGVKICLPSSIKIEHDGKDYKCGIDASKSKYTCQKIDSSKS